MSVRISGDHVHISHGPFVVDFPDDPAHWNALFTTLGLLPAEPRRPDEATDA